MLLKLILCLTAISHCYTLDNGLGLKPPMGWLSWLRYMCTVDCKTYPTSCISEVLIKQMADQMAIGFKDVGYEYVMIDDCWLAKSRAPDGSLLPDPDRFPSGINALTDYVHKKGLKFGIYEDVGIWTCAGYPGSLLHLEQDAKTFASWNVDYVKFDGCYNIPSFEPHFVTRFSEYLNKTGRQIFLNVEWPLYIGVKHMSEKMVPILINTTNMARVFSDVAGNWKSLRAIIEFYQENQNNFSFWARPGYVNDPDMLMIGNNYITLDQEKLQMTMWAMFAAPLIMSNDLRNISAQSVAILTNKNIISVNQDPLMAQGKYIKTINNVQIWLRVLSGYRKALALVNLESSPNPITFTMEDVGEIEDGFYYLIEVYDMKLTYNVTKQSNLTLNINPTSGQIFVYKRG